MNSYNRKMTSTMSDNTQGKTTIRVFSFFFTSLIFPKPFLPFGTDTYDH